MYKFTVKYYCARYHTGEIKEHEVRTAIVFGKDKGEAIEKIKQADKCFIAVADLSFEEMVGDTE